jgi:hypothetical protein
MGKPSGKKSTAAANLNRLTKALTKYQPGKKKAAVKRSSGINFLHQLGSEDDE